jgi:hypothetical protein
MKFRTRGFISLLLALSFLVAVVSGSVLFMTPRGRIANWTDWTMGGLTKHEWAALHINACLLMVIEAVIHLLLNWRVFWSYIQKKSTGFHLKWELAASILITGAVCSRPDPLVDDQAMFFETRDGIVVLLGCAHSGVVNTLQYVDHLTGRKPIHAVLGGMHLIGASAERLARTIEALRNWDIRLLAPAHCTGMAATAALWNAFPGRCTTCHAGSRFEFEVP